MRSGIGSCSRTAPLRKRSRRTRCSTRCWPSSRSRRSTSAAARTSPRGMANARIRSHRRGHRSTRGRETSRPRRCARSNWLSVVASTVCSPATTARRSPESAASSGSCGRTSPATTCVGSSGTSRREPVSRTFASSSPSVCSSRGSSSTRPLRWRSAPAIAPRRTSQKGWRSRSATPRRAAGTGSARSPSATASR